MKKTFEELEAAVDELNSNVFKQLREDERALIESSGWTAEEYHEALSADHDAKYPPSLLRRLFGKTRLFKWLILIKCNYILMRLNEVFDSYDKKDAHLIAFVEKHAGHLFERKQ